MSRTKKILLSVSLIVFVIAIGFVLYRVIASQDGQKKLSKQKVYSELQLVEGKLLNTRQFSKTLGLQWKCG